MTLGLLGIVLGGLLEMLNVSSNMAPAVCSWYGEPFHGRLTASGIVYDMNEFSCAHRTLPHGSLVVFYCKDTRKSLLLRVEDRGPFVEGRDFDLSKAAFEYLTADLDLGVVTMEQRVVGRYTQGLCYNL